MINKYLNFITLVTLTSLSPLLFAATNNVKLPIASFSSESLDQWEDQIFKNKTDYKLVQLDCTTALKAESLNSASGLVKKQRIDLQSTPILNWRWRIESRLNTTNEQVKEGDDYAARVYVIISGGLAFWQTKAINYVWANTSSKGTSWPNAFAGDHAVMLALRSSADPTGTWFNEKRNILADLKQYFGEDIRYIDAIAIMTDTDNSHGKATTYYGDIYFTAN
ncbi:MAG: DUF3047 domain-containing protein [Methylococcales bacterium]|nr:DUF3047 domain-containing protein [Methylococcaceae bacterium]